MTVVTDILQWVSEREEILRKAMEREKNKDEWFRLQGEGIALRDVRERIYFLIKKTDE